MEMNAAAIEFAAVRRNLRNEKDVSAKTSFGGNDLAFREQTSTNMRLIASPWGSGGRLSGALCGKHLDKLISIFY
jgi:hypothetical protein